MSRLCRDKPIPNILANTEEVRKIEEEVKIFLLARELGVTPDEIMDKPMKDVEKWSMIQGALSEAQKHKAKKAERKMYR